MGPHGPFTGLEVADDTGKSVHLAQVKSVVPIQDDTSWKRTSGSPLATGEDDKKAAGLESASTQAVKRGHQVIMVEVPDEEDNTAYRWWLTKGSSIVSLTRRTAMLPTLPDSPVQIG